jgi:hypothetical protein
MEQKNSLDYDEVFARYITRNGKRIYPKKGKYFHFFVKKKPATKNVTGISS